MNEPRISDPKVPVSAWQSILFLGRYLFHGPRHPIDLDALVGAISLP